LFSLAQPVSSRPPILFIQNKNVISPRSSCFQAPRIIAYHHCHLRLQGQIKVSHHCLHQQHKRYGLPKPASRIQRTAPLYGRLSGFYRAIANVGCEDQGEESGTGEPKAVARPQWGACGADASARREAVNIVRRNRRSALEVCNISISADSELETAVAAVLSNWHNVLRAINMASSEASKSL